MNDLAISFYKYNMPPKKSQQKVEEKSDQPKIIEKQTKLFGKND